MKIVFVVPNNYKSVGGMKLPISNHKRCLEMLGNEVIIVEIPYHYSPFSKAWDKIKEDIYKVLQDADCILGYPLNQAYILKKYLIRNYKGYTIAFLADSLRLHEESVRGINKRLKDFMAGFLRWLLYTKKDRFCLCNYDKIIYSSTVDVEFVKSHYNVSKQKILYVPNGTTIPEKAYYSDPNEESITIGMLTDFEPINLKENFYPFIDKIIPALENSGLKFNVLIAGKGADEKMMKRFSQSNRIHYLGYVKDLADFYGGVDVIISTVYKRSGIINRILEAWGYGKLVVGFSRNFETFSDAIEGVHYLSADNCDDFVRILSDVANKKINCKAFGEKARELVKQNYTWTSVTRILMEDLASNRN